MKSKIIKGLLLRYKNHPCLWDMSDTNYHNNNQKIKAYLELLKYYRKFEPDATLDLVKGKIANLRGTFRKELKKVITSKKAGMVPVYTPKVWYYDLLLFLSRNMNATRGEPDDIFDHTNNSLSNDEQDLEAEHPGGESQIDDDSLWEPLLEHTSRKRNFRSSQDPIDEEYEAVSKYITVKLKKMTEQQRSFAEILINQVIVFGATGRLREDTVVTPLNPFIKSIDEEEESS